TTATVRMPISLASCATTGAAPVPVPPPMPAVMNTMSAPCRASMMTSRSSSAAWRPTSGLAPAPRPLVTLSPSCSCSLAPQLRIACESVLAVMNSTPSTLLATMCATALPPPPPTPITLMLALGAIFSTSSKCAMSCVLFARVFWLCFPVEPIVSAAFRPLLPARGAPSERASVPLLQLPEKVPGRAGGNHRPARMLDLAAHQQQAHAGGVNRVADHFAQAGHVLGNAHPHRHLQHF